MVTDAGLSCVRFLRRPPPASDEDFRGFLLRLGAANGYTEPLTLKRFVGAVKRKLRAPNGVAKIARYIGINEQELANLIARAEEIRGATERPGQFARTCFYRDRYSAFCPACLRETGIFRAIWNFRAVVACDKHGLWLIDLCPVCNKSIDWDRCRVAHCECGFDLRDSDSTSAQTDVSLLTKLLVERLQGGPNADLVEHGYFPELANISTLEWLAVCSFFASTGDGLYRFHAGKAAGMERERRAITIAARVFQNWPETSFEEIRTCWGACELNDDDGPLLTLRQLKGRPPYWYMTRLSGALRLPTFLATAFDQHVARLTIHSQGRGLVINPAIVTLSSDGTLVLEALAHDEAMALGIDVGSASTHPSVESVIQKLRREPPDLYSGPDVECLIGATRRQRLVLGHVNLLRPMVDGRWILSSELKRFQRWLHDMSLPCDPPASIVPLNAFSRTYGSLLARVILAIDAGQIRIFRRPECAVALNTCFISQQSISTNGDEIS